jgi:ATP-dependent DNA helicase RecG
MNRDEIVREAALGEDTRRQFKADMTNADSLAADLVAFSNSSGGVILIGVHDDGTVRGLALDDVRRINQLIANAATQHIRSPISPVTENVPVGEGRVVIVLTVAEGIDKPYFDRQGVIWVKAGSDRRRIQSKEELRRLFQMTDQFHADELPTKAGMEALDRPRLRDYLRDVYKQDYPDSPAALLQLLQNLNLATDTGVLTLAGLLLFAEQPERFKPQFTVKAIRYPGNDIHANAYLDSEDFAGPLRTLFGGAMAFVQRNLHKVQAGRGVNALGVPEIPAVVFEELLVNALMHRDYLISAPIRLFVFDNRIEIVSPGHLPNHLTVAKIQAGNTNIRNPILVSHVAKGLLPYRGLGTGVRRALAEWPGIEFIDDHDACTFTATVHWAKGGTAPVTEAGTSRKDAGKAACASANASTNASLTEVQDQILHLISAEPAISQQALAVRLGKNRTTIMRNVQHLKSLGLLCRVGSKKLGHWIVRDPAP